MKDRIFSGTDVEEALAAAGATLGLPIAELRYVVLDTGSEPGRGLKPTPARIAVLIQGSAGGAGHARQAPPPPSRPQDSRTALRALVHGVAEAGSLDLGVTFEETDEALVLHIQGPDSSFLHGPDGWGKPLLALEHLLQRTYAAAGQSKPLKVRCQGYRERRDGVLADEARRLATAVRADGQPRTMEPYNAYDRRIVHMALQGEPGVRTFSVGEGRDRRVTIAPSADGASAPGAASGEGNGQ